MNALHINRVCNNNIAKERKKIKQHKPKIIQPKCKVNEVNNLVFESSFGYDTKILDG